MLTLLLALAVSQSTVTDEFTPPPSPSPAAAERAPLPSPVEPAGAREAPRGERSARLLPEEPRVSGGALAGRVGMSIAMGLLGELVGELTGVGLLALGAVSGSTGVVVATLIVGTLMRLGCAAIGVAIGAALFGDHFGADLSAAMPVAAIAVSSAVLLGLLLSLALPFVSPLLLVGVPLLAAAIATPLIVQARKSDAEARVMKDALPMSGPSVAF